MICRELIELLEKKYPPSIAESWDNPGLQVGSYEKEIKSIYIALDATGEVIRHAIDAKSRSAADASSDADAWTEKNK